MNNDDRTRVLRGLVEHEGRWIPVGDKIKLLESKDIPELVHDFEEKPLSAHETAAVARFADALKGEETDSWSISQSSLRNAILEAKAAENEEADTAFDRYQKAQKKKKIFVLIVLLAITVSAAILFLLNR
jgi:hypothetical protein